MQKVKKLHRHHPHKVYKFLTNHIYSFAHKTFSQNYINTKCLSGLYYATQIPNKQNKTKQKKMFFFLFTIFKVYYTQVQEPIQTQTITHTKSYQQPIFDFKKFFNFGVYKRLGFGHGFGHGYGNTVQVQQIQPQQDTYIVEEKVVPQVIYEKRVVPKVVYEKRIVPEVIIEKKVINQTVVVHKKVETPPPSPPQTTTVVKSVAPAISIKKEVKKKMTKENV